MANSDEWRWLWRLHIPRRCKVFLWLALNDTLPRESPQTSHFSFSHCPFCHTHETLLHVLRDCPRARSVWVHLVAPQHQHAFFSCSLSDWIVTHLQQPWSSVNDDHNKDGILLAATVWLLWKDRKGWVSDGPCICSERVLHRVCGLAHDYGRVVEAEHSSPTTALRNVSWCFYWNQVPSQLQLRSVVDTSRVPCPRL